MRSLIPVALAAVVLASSAFADTTVPAAARAEFDKAEIAREEGRLEEAAALYRKAIELHALYFDAHAGYLASLRGQGDLTPAQALYKDLVPKHAQSIDLKVFQAATLDPPAAIAALQALAGGNPDSVRAWIELGRAQLTVGQRRDAEKSLKEALKRNSDSPLARVLMGDAFLQNRKFSRARKEYQEALSTDNAYVPAHLRLAMAWHLSGKPLEAIKILGKLVSDDNYPNLVAGHWLLAIVRMDLGKHDDAMKSVDKILTIDKGDYTALIAKGHMLLVAEKPVEASVVFAKAAEGRTSPAEALFCLGWAYEKAADGEGLEDAKIKEWLAKSAEAYEKCAEADPTVRPRDSLGFVLLLGDKHADAVKQFKRAADIDQKFAAAVNNLGLSWDISDNRALAKKKYEQVLSKIDKRNVRAHVMLALDLWLDGSAPKAIKEIEKALKIKPDDDLAWTFLGDIHYDNGKVDRSIRAYKEAVKINEKNFFAWYHMGIAYDEDKRKFEDASKCYEKAHEATLNPPVDLFMRLGEINDSEFLDRLEKALSYYEAYVANDGPVDGERAWIPERIEELKELLKKKK